METRVIASPFILTSIRRNQNDSWSVINEDCQGRNRPTPSPLASRRRAHINTETWSFKRNSTFLRKQDGKAISIVLPFRQNFMTLLHFPETLSRVILALLGSVFQTNLSDTRQIFKSARNRNNDQTENSVIYNIIHLGNPQTSVCGKTPQRRKQEHGETLK